MFNVLWKLNRMPESVAGFQYHPCHMENQRMKQSCKTRRLAHLSEIFCTSWRVTHKESKELYSSWKLQDWANQRFFGPSTRWLCPRWPETRQGQRRCSGWLRAASMHSQGVNTGCHAVSLNSLSRKPESSSWVVFSFRSFRGCRTSVCLICESRGPYPWNNEFFFFGGWRLFLGPWLYRQY